MRCEVIVRCFMRSAAVIRLDTATWCSSLLNGTNHHSSIGLTNVSSCVYHCRRYPAARAVMATLNDWMTVYGWPLTALWTAPVDMYYYIFPELDMSYEVYLVVSKAITV